VRARISDRGDAGGRGLRRIRLDIAYEGTSFVGWQRQKNGLSVQQVIEEALAKITGHPVTLSGAGRTDSGVHAEGQVAHGIIQSAMSPPLLQKALNATLPETIVIRSVRKVPDSFNARFSAKSKWYRYTIWNSKIRPLEERHRARWVYQPLDLRAMRQAARMLQGRHDFKPFQSSGSKDAGSTIRDLFQLTIRQDGPRLYIDAKANGFLYHMVRRLAGLLIEVGKGNLPPEEAKKILGGKSRFIVPSAPAQGLCLMRVSYR
jgi:tRNA pseudouridine38-40 synthase